MTDHIVLPAPSGPVVKHTWGWECGNVEVEDLADADGWAAELPQHIADSRAIAAHIRGLTPTLAEDVATVEQRMEGNAFARAALRRVIAAALAGEAK